MEHNDNQQSGAHKGVIQRRSYSNIGEQGGIKMDRQGSKSSTASTETTLSVEPTDHDKTPGQPHNFGAVAHGIYRSSYPKEADYPFLKKLGLKTIITLVDKDIPESFLPFMKASNIQHRQIVMEGTKKQTIPIGTMASILELVHDKRNQPVLIHCNQGKHRTGCVVAIARMLQQRDIESIIEEYKAFAEPKVRDGDVEYIRNFRLADISHLEFARPAVRPLKKESLLIPTQREVRLQPTARAHNSQYLVLSLLAIFIIWHCLNGFAPLPSPSEGI